MSETDYQSAFFGVIAAKSARADYLDLRLIPDGLDSRLDALGELRVAAMADDDFAAVVAALFHILDYRIERFLAAAYLLLYLNRIGA